ncbi:DNA-directed RNA polymerase I subunit RPA43 isoform X2 [Hyla sarda]|uniref:DNA-directed RNA polymerase I subunit RPA43 isoform X2 n=1 Tax=Hyla sarda TaxID=327740 RepID=UPI0024C31179|nr:DNA-directed RNA polymerase I subunit RPA43 isoform X2 [Hyla sarda]
MPNFSSTARAPLDSSTWTPRGHSDTSLEGVPVAYDNIKIVGELGDIFDDIGFIHINVEADFVIFQPQCGQKLVGVVNKKAPSHLGCLVHGCFNASIPRPMKMPIEAWQQLEVDVGDELEFEVFRMDSDAVGVFCIRGKLNKKMESDATEKLNAMSKEQNANVPNEGQNSTETSGEGAAGMTSILSGDSSKKKGKKRLLEETLSQNECMENQDDANVSLVETPKKKRKKQKHQEVPSQDHSVGVDGSAYNSAMENLLTHPDSTQDVDIDASVDSGVVGLDNVSSQEHKTKKPKKKKHKDHPDLESSVPNGITEGSLIEDNILGLETEPGNAKKKHKKKHKNTSEIQDQGPANGIVSASSQETPVDDLIIHQEAPKVKKHKKKHRDTTELDSENGAFHTKDGREDSSTLATSSKEVSERKVKKKRRKESL